MAQVIFYDIDIFDRVISLPNITEQRTFRRDKLITNEYDIVVRNVDNFFTPTNKASLVYGTDWLYQPIKVIGDNDETVWDGIVTKIIRNVNNMAKSQEFNKYYRSKR